ncbi:DsbE family thiol:disulfide interchange protein [Shinella sp.]|uniref:DsbE family thiol:disulfide interchange protein n=1 Tax=Shinella sp. TaxID=1870904 RepID=UPI003F7043FB
MSETESTTESAGTRTRVILAALPLAIFVAMAAVFFVMLTDPDRNVSDIPSALIGTKAPWRDLEPLAGAVKDGLPMPALTAEGAKGKLTLVNFWASWCVPCRQEHPVILSLSKDPRLNVVGVNYKDGSENALRFLGELGNPFSAIGLDPVGKMAIDWGVYGIPESYLVGPDGTILYKKVGPFDENSLKNGLFPAIEKALGALAS